MRADLGWGERLALDVHHGYLKRSSTAPGERNPQVVLNGPGSVLRTVRTELRNCSSFLFSVAFVSPGAIALLKQELIDFAGQGRIVTSDYLGFNSPAAFAELLNLRGLGIDVRLHNDAAFHPKGYIFEYPDVITAMVGSSNLTKNALVTNHEWNLKVTASRESDLATQFAGLVERQLADSTPLTDEWVQAYANSYVAPARRSPHSPAPDLPIPLISPNSMQLDALAALADVRNTGEQRAIVISATGTGKTILSALDVRAAAPDRALFVVHREQILDRTIEEYRRVLGGPETDFGKLTGSAKQLHARYLFATVQTLSQPSVLAQFAPDSFDYVIIDEAHRAAAEGHQRVIDHFRPKFLLGMTATPERTDAYNVFELFDYNVPYEIRLGHALESEMLCPFHYYGIADVTFVDGVTTSSESELKVLISPQRVDHLINALELYGQAGVAPHGLIFCSRTEEARELSNALNQRTLRGRPLRTVALTGGDSIPVREAAVEQLERGELDYLLTVDVFNEGIDIPCVNQVIMLRQTQSAIVFVQQLGRGLRKVEGKDYIVVLDFIGNYTNNFMIPIALFGDESLNKESLKQRLISAEEEGVLPGLASVRFDRVAQERVLSSIAKTKLDSIQNLKKAIEALRNRLGRVPALGDFLRFESVDPVVLATARESYPDLVERVLKVPSELTPAEAKALKLLSYEVLTAKRLHEFVLVRELLAGAPLSTRAIADRFAELGLPHDDRTVASAIDTLTLEHHVESDQKSYVQPIAARLPDDAVALTGPVLASYFGSTRFEAAVDDLLETGAHLVRQRYEPARPFTPGRQYSRKETSRLLCWQRNWAPTIYGYKVSRTTGSCAIFVTLHKAEEIIASIAYEDELLDPSTMLWYTRSRRTLQSDEVRAIVDNEVSIHVFAKKDDAEGSDFYYLGQARSAAAEQTTMPDDHGKPLPVVRMLLHFDEQIQSALYDYLHPSVTAL